MFVGGEGECVIEHSKQQDIGEICYGNNHVYQQLGRDRDLFSEIYGDHGYDYHTNHEKDCRGQQVRGVFLTSYVGFVMHCIKNGTYLEN